MSLAATIRAMAAAGCSVEQIAAVSAQFEEAEKAAVAEKRANDAERKRRSRAAASAMSRGHSVTPCDAAEIGGHPVTSCDAGPSRVDNTSASAPVISNGSSFQSEPLLDTPDLKIGPPTAEAARSARSFLFDRFYRAYPKHTNPKSAETKFAAALKAGVSAEKIITAAERFADACRRARTEKQFIPAPDVWLNKGRYDDEDLPEPQARAGPSPQRKRLHPTERMALGITNDAEEDAYFRSFETPEPQHERPDPPAHDGPTIDLDAADFGEPGAFDQDFRVEKPHRGNQPHETADLWGPRADRGGPR